MSRTRTTAAVSAALLASATLLLGACGGSSEDGADSASSSGDVTADQLGAPADGPVRTEGGLADSSTALEGLMTEDSQSDVKAGTQAGGQAGTSPLAEITVERQVIATAEMTLRSQDVDATVDAIESIAVAANGYVSARDVQNNPDDPDRTRATVVVRVPTSKLDLVIDDVQAEGDLVRVVSDEQDVTQTVVDVNSRVRSAQASVNRIRILLSQANTIGDVVRIESELARREADLESLQAQQRALADQTAMATLSVTVLAPEAAAPGPAPSPEDDEGFVAGLQRGWNALVDVVVVALTTLGVALPFAVVALLVALPFGAAWRRRHPRGPQPQSSTADGVA